MSPEDAPRTTEGVLASTDVSHHYFLSTETGARQTYPISDNITLSLNDFSGHHIMFLLIMQYICVIFFLTSFSITLVLFPPWKKEYHDKNFFQTFWALIWLGITSSRFILLLIMTHLRLSTCNVPTRLVLMHRIVRCIGILWYIYGIKPLFWDAPKNTYAIVLARSFWLLHALFFVVPLFLYLMLCLCLPCLLLLRHRLQRHSTASTPTPENILSKLQVKQYKEVISNFVKSLDVQNSNSAQVFCDKKNGTGLTRVEKSCPICMVDFEKTDQVMIMPCDERHFFHVNCVRVWLSGSQFCPICRANVVEKLNEELLEKQTLHTDKENFSSMA